MPVGYTPIFRINQEGVDITSRFNDRLTQIKTTLTGGRGVQDTCEITLDDRDWKIASPTVGRKLEIYLGYKEVGLAQQNVFEIKTVEYLGPPRSIKITGTSTSFIGSLKAPTIKEFDGKTIKDVLNDIGKKAGVEVMVEQGLGEIKIPYLNQTQSSLHLLQELERRYGAVAKFDSGKLIFIPQDGRETASGATIPKLLLRPEHLARWSVRHDRRGDYSAARAAYIDPQTNEPTWIEEQNPRALTDDDGKAERYPFRLPQMFKNESEARASAKSTISTLNRSLGEINVTLAKGDPWVRAPQPVMLQQMREGINGIYVSETVTHTYLKSEGILTTITGKPPGSSEDIPAGAGSDVEVVGPQAGQKLGAKYVAPVFSDT